MMWTLLIASQVTKYLLLLWIQWKIAPWHALYNGSASRSTWEIHRKRENTSVSYSGQTNTTVILLAVTVDFHHFFIRVSF